MKPRQLNSAHFPQAELWLAATPFEHHSSAGKNEHVNSYKNVEWDTHGPRMEVESNSNRSYLHFLEELESKSNRTRIVVVAKA